MFGADGMYTYSVFLLVTFGEGGGGMGNGGLLWVLSLCLFPGACDGVCGCGVESPCRPLS